MQDLQGKTAFITGGSSGIGLALAQLLAAEGMRVAIGYRSTAHRDAALEQFAPGAAIVPIAVDIADRASLERAAADVRERFGKLHLLACNAGVFLPTSLMQTTYDDWDWEIGVNLTGTFNTLKAFVPLLLEHGEPAWIAATASVLGLLGSAVAPAYSASKFGTVGLLEALAAELGATRVGVTIFSPGFVRTNVADWQRNRPGDRKPSGDSAANPQAWTDPNLSMDPLTAAGFMLDAIKAGQLHAIANWEYLPALDARARMIRNGVAQQSEQSAERVSFGQSFLGRSIYRTHSAQTDGD